MAFTDDYDRAYSAELYAYRMHQAQRKEKSRADAIAARRRELAFTATAVDRRRAQAIAAKNNRTGG